MRWVFLLFLVLIAASVTAINTAPFFNEAATNGSHTVAVGDYTVANGVFKLQPPADEVWYVHRMLVHYEDFGTMDTGSYGNGITLTNGIYLRQNISGVLYNLTNDHPIYTNGDWSAHNYDVRLDQYNSGNQFIVARWTFANSGTVIKLDGSVGDSIDIVITDNVSGLIDQKFLFQGYKGESTEGMNLVILLSLIFGSVMFLVLGWIAFKDHWFIKMLFTGFSFLTFYIMTAYVVSKTANVTTQSMFKLMNWASALLLLYLIGYSIYYIIEKSPAFKKYMGRRI